MPELENRTIQKRQIAYKTGIKDMLDSDYIKREGFEPNYLKINGLEISRVNVIGVVVQKLDTDNHKNILIDDGTGEISARIFEDNALLDKINVSDIVIIIGRPREFSAEKYILIESIKKIDSKWAEVRKLELKRDVSKAPVVGIPAAEDNTGNKEIVDLSPSNEIVNLIKELDKGEGVSIEEIYSKNKDADKLVNMLLKEGDVFEVKPGKLKVLE
ncbi:MAG: OB-fold nucleic acid binding domain-containing protein [Candidatus Woesearchaeota archaeon]|jgi:RPA family protein|nr:OB-fold nucleic acid binding domain-containing protein [Candidatus Woesearchaeota archaeon]MDP7622969.1 OB-fold nucleic acid binding domain-containing protein [Candidatus Woesearchaeota archaeon]HJN56400.1 OB-fold nucleic acid binding domain-containing protein [Candidatus Woesearchaeota archaeon]|tara:strand:- start:11668 stop:12312 length:645 start_codon:yes stop_codon:yes gene_type:complete